MVVGIDEVGRGCWAGPLVAAAVLLYKPVLGLTDSKLLSKRQRNNLAEKIKESATFGYGWVAPHTIDRLGLTKATSIAMLEAVNSIADPYNEIIIDGTYNYLLGQSVLQSGARIETMARADLIVPSVSAASILAKVARDDYMTIQSRTFPGYGFEAHVGYGTAKHIDALKRLGVCTIHRLSYKPVRDFLK